MNCSLFSTAASFSWSTVTEVPGPGAGVVGPAEVGPGVVTRGVSAEENNRSVSTQTLLLDVPVDQGSHRFCNFFMTFPCPFLDFA